MKVALEKVTKKTYSLVVVDDEATVLNILGWVFKEEGYEVHTFNRAAGALEFIQENSIHVIISDYQMPGIDGLQFVHALREAGWKGAFIFLSGHTEPLKCANRENMGIFRIIPKPFSLIELTECVREALESL